MPDIADIKPLYFEAWPYLQAAIIAFIILALCIALWYGIKYWRQKQSNKPKPLPVMYVPSCYEIAMQALKNLCVPAVGNNIAGTANEASSLYYFDLSIILRAFVEGRFAINATDLTTEEIWQQLQKNIEIDNLASNNSRIMIKRLLTRSDEVKFARIPATESDMHADKAWVETFVQTVWNEQKKGN